jgi:endopolygalacturonase
MTNVSTLSVAQGRLTGAGDSAVWASVQPRLETYIKQELAKLPTPSQPGISQEKAEEIVRNAIQALNLPSSFLTENRVNELVQTAINALPTPAPGITEQRVTELISQAVGRLPAPGTSEERAKQLIADALEELKKSGVAGPRGERGEPGTPGAPGAPGAPGKDADMDAVRAFVTSEVQRLIPPTSGVDETKAKSLIDEALAKLPKQSAFHTSARSVNVLQEPYNADPTGQTDSTDAIQRAILDVHNLGGGAVFIPAGVYLVSFPFIELKGMVFVYGEGSGTQIVATTSKAINQKTGVFRTGTWNNRAQDPSLLRFGVNNLWIKSRRAGYQHQNFIPNLCGVLFNTDLGSGPADPDAVPSCNFLEIWGMETGAAFLGTDDQAMKVFSLKVRNAGQAGLVVGKPDGHPEGTGGAADNKFYGADIGGSNTSLDGYAGIEVYTSQTKFVGSTSWYTKGNSTFAQLYAQPSGSRGVDVTAGSPQSANRAGQKGGAGWFIKATKCTFSACEAQENGGHGWIVAYGDNLLDGCRGESSSYGDTAKGEAGANSAADFYICNTGAEGTVLLGCTSRSARKGSGGARWSFYIESWFRGLTIQGCVSMDVSAPAEATGLSVPVRVKDPQGTGVYIQVGPYRVTSYIYGPKVVDLIVKDMDGVQPYGDSVGERNYLMYNPLYCNGQIHIEALLKKPFVDGGILFTLPESAPAPIRTVKSIVDGMSIYVNAGSRDVLVWGMGNRENVKVITDLVGFFAN